MIAANEAVAALLEQRGVPCLYRVHERPEPERVERLVDQLASLEVPTPPLPDHISRAAGGRARRRDVPARRAARARSGRGRIALSSLVLRSLKQAYYSPAQPRPRGPAFVALLPLHLADPPLPRSRLPPRAALGGRRRRARAAGRRSSPSSGEWTSERERDAMTPRARRRRCRALLRPGARLYELRTRAALRRRGRRADLGRAFIAFRARPAAPTRACCRCGACAARRRSRLGERLVGDRRAGHDPRGRAHRRDAAPRRSDRGARGRRGCGPRPRRLIPAAAGRSRTRRRSRRASADHRRAAAWPRTI